MSTHSPPPSQPPTSWRREYGIPARCRYLNILYCVKMNGGCPTPCIARNGRTTFVKSPVTTASGAPNAPAPIATAANNTSLFILFYRPAKNLIRRCTWAAQASMIGSASLSGGTNAPLRSPKTLRVDLM